MHCFRVVTSDISHITESSYIPQADTSQDAICTGPALWYALDATTSTSMNTVAKKKASQIYLLQTNSSELYFGMLNGKSSANGGAVASLRLSFSHIMWLIRTKMAGAE